SAPVHLPLYHLSAHDLALHSFPTRRSSDLEASPAARGMSLADLYSQIGHNLLGEVMVHTTDTGLEWSKCDHCGEDFTTTQPEGEIGRAQSELQSRENLVCRLLLEKKKKTNK